MDGLVFIFSGGHPCSSVRAIGREPVTLGRVEGAAAGEVGADTRMSRRHARVARDGEGWVITDLESRNGTFVDGVRLQGTRRFAGPEQRILRLGSTVALLTRQLEIHREGVTLERGLFIGATLRPALARIARAAKTQELLLVRAPSGAGKENAARTFHQHGPRARGPFVPVNCAAIPEGLAERLLFGAKRGAYSGAHEDADGLVAAADGGVLFLDEVGELDLEIQAKLLRVLESREVLPLGASRPRVVDFSIVCATHRDLRARVAEGAFRADLYYRIGAMEVVLPGLAERPDELPFIIARELERLSGRVSVHGSFIEACLLRPWPGNVRELLGAVQRAFHGLEIGDELRAEHLDAEAGCLLTRPEAPASVASAMAAPRAEATERERILAALAACGGNQSQAAERLGIARRTLINRLDALGIAGPRKARDPKLTR